MQPLPLACFLSLIRPPGVQFETALLQSYALDKNKCPFVLDGHDIDFLLYTRNNPLVPQTLLVGDDERLFASNMDFNDPTVFLFHGFMETPDDGSPLLIREAYMYRGDTNVITVDSSRLEAGPWYFTAADNTWYIGNFAARLVDYLVSRGLKLSNTHFVGHSLGAQSAGVAGSALTSGRVARITGLDPAWPVFCKLPPPQRLDETDAEFVDVIHADAGIFGFKYAVGHVDFWPNGGRSPQPGCELSHTLPKQLLLNNCGNTKHCYNVYLRDHTQDEKNTRQTVDIASYLISRNKMTLANKINPAKKFGAVTADKHTHKKRKTFQYKQQQSKIENSNSEHHRQRRFVPFFKSEATENENFLFRILEFLMKHRKNVIPIVTVVREINTLVKSSNGELNHFVKERNNYIGTPPPFQPVTYTLELDNNSKWKTFVKKLFGLRQGDNLSITSSRK
ncbi:phospholipase A1 1-like isoform X1 [Aricia agestis]|uniref:phospholipase A1 1-like isoform X1 n=1 Tax=Aricia agestis TaxID=91739 RepID=UPI001C20BABB|nr:phospholipase A1 1-like isoform X1 [Aricia agestis]